MEEVEIFKSEICHNCKNNNCEKGIAIVRSKNELYMKCCDYIPKNKLGNREMEIIKYFEKRKAND